MYTNAGGDTNEGDLALEIFSNSAAHGARATSSKPQFNSCLYLFSPSSTWTLGRFSVIYAGRV